MKRRRRPVIPASADDGYRAGIVRRMAQHNVSVEIAKTQEIGDGLGRLFLTMIGKRKMSKHVATSALDVTRRAEETISAYNAHVIGAPPPTPRGADMDGVRGGSDGELPDEVVESIKSRYDRLRRSIPEKPLWLVLERYCLGDSELETWRPTEVTKLLNAINRLMSHGR